MPPRTRKQKDQGLPAGKTQSTHILGYKRQQRVEEKQKAQQKYPENGSSSIFFTFTTSLTNHNQAPDTLDTNGDTDTREVLDCVSITTRKSSDVAQAMNIAHAEARLRAVAARTK